MKHIFGDNLMKLTRKQLTVILISIFGISLLGGISTYAVLNSTKLKISYLESGYNGNMSSVLIEIGGKQIYIDPFSLDEKFKNKKADIIFITHPHYDHYDQDTIDLIKKDSTIFVMPSSCPKIMSANNGTHEVVSVAPNYTGIVDEVSFEVIPAYNVNALMMDHLKSDNWCGYIISLGGYTILQTGDTSYIPEYENIVTKIDIAILPIGWACSNMGIDGSLKFIETVRPTHVIPIHYGNYLEDFDTFSEACSTDYPNVEVHRTQLYLKKK